MFFAIEHNERILLRKGNWKLVHEDGPYDSDSFKLYNLENDLGEVNDLKNSNPDKFKEMMEHWEEFSREVKPQFPTPVNESN